MLPDADRPYTRRSTGKQQVANLQGHETADISNDVIHFEKHIRRIPALHFFTVYIGAIFLPSLQMRTTTSVS